MASASNLNLGEINPEYKPFTLKFPEGIVPAEEIKLVVGQALLRYPSTLLENIGEMDAALMPTLTMFTVGEVHADKYVINERITRVHEGANGAYNGVMWEAETGAFRTLNKASGQQRLRDNTPIDFWLSDNDHRAAYVRESDSHRLLRNMVEARATIHFEPAQDSSLGSILPPPSSSAQGEFRIVSVQDTDNGHASGQGGRQAAGQGAGQGGGQGGKDKKGKKKAEPKAEPKAEGNE